ncbi:MAG: hypothetical protein LAQ30_25315 [Acidobacteriia bacterium]|nr:hypothetical protein [Terriglobia bacterium]
MLITEERIRHAQEKLAAHRRNGSTPDERITRQILGQFDDIGAFDSWMSGLWASLQPWRIHKSGYGLYLTNARKWTMAGCNAAQPQPQSTVEDTMAPETRRRLEARRAAARKSEYFDVTTITGPQPERFDPRTITDKPLPE